MNPHARRTSSFKTPPPWTRRSIIADAAATSFISHVMSAQPISRLIEERQQCKFDGPSSLTTPPTTFNHTLVPAHKRRLVMARATTFLAAVADLPSVFTTHGVVARRHSVHTTATGLTLASLPAAVTLRLASMVVAFVLAQAQQTMPRLQVELILQQLLHRTLHRSLLPRRQRGSAMKQLNFRSSHCYHR